ncbi:MAG: PocR ligand-binding domain-containing protein [Clostridia bacterium]|nr:PocR ligand-binding domain-containing protein [Clostridia bacterium]
MAEITEIISVLKDFYEISGFRVSIHDIDFEEIYSYPSEISSFCKRIQEDGSVKVNCIKCDNGAFEKVRRTNKVYVYKCSSGLLEAVAPIYHYGILSGYLMMGQVRDGSEANLDYIRNSCKSVFQSEKEALKYINAIPVISPEKLEAYIHLLQVIAEYLTQSNRINPGRENLAEAVKKYLHRNYNRKITLDELATHFGCCKSSIMNNFRQSFGTTVVEYLTKIRLEQAVGLICSTERSIKEIALSCGFADQNYFSRIFNSKYNCSPSEYRQKNMNLG